MDGESINSLERIIAQSMYKEAAGLNYGRDARGTVEDHLLPHCRVNRQVCKVPHFLSFAVLPVTSPSSQSPQSRQTQPFFFPRFAFPRNNISRLMVFIFPLIS